MRFLLLILILTLRTSLAATTIGTEASVEFKDEYKWNAGVNFQPGDGETVTMNPPKFGWTFQTSMPWMDPSVFYKFTLQISTNSNFSDYIVNVDTAFNFYNFLAPMPTGVTIYWRVKYIDVADDSLDFTSATRTFTVSPSASEWDRSLPASSNYMTARATHPYMLFNATNKAALSTFILDAYANRNNSATANYVRHTGFQWAYTKYYADQAIAATWLTNYTGTNGANALVAFDARCEYLATIAYVWNITGDGTYTNRNPMKQLASAATNFINQGLWKADPVQYQDAFRLEDIALAYDMFYNVLSAEERTVCRQAISLFCNYTYYGAYHNGTWRGVNDPNAWENAATNYTTYTGGYFSTQYSPQHQGTSHWHDQHYLAFRSALAIYNEDPWARESVEFGLNYLINRGTPFGDQAGVNQGRSYGMGGFGSVITAHVRAAQIFPEVNFQRNPTIQSNVMFWDYMVPVGFRPGNEPWGDGDFAATHNATWGRTDWGRNFALISSNGIAWRHYTNAIGATVITDDHGDENRVLTYQHVGLAYFFPPPASASNSETAYAFPADGWGFASSSPPNDYTGYTNGVGIVFQARPRGSEGGHSHYSDLSFQIWAYGANVTDAGGDYGAAIAKVPEGHYSLLINGFGTVQGAFKHNEQNAAKLIGYTNNSSFSYFAADATLAYPRKVGFNNADAFASEPYKTQLQGNPQLGHVTNVQRQIVFPRKKYFVIRDTLAATNASTYAWVYHILEPTLTLDSTARTFTYTATNQYHGSNVTVYVAHITNPTGLTIHNQTGANVSRNPITTTNFPSGAHPRSNTLWFKNTSTATSWTFTTVIYPKKWDATAPTITRIDDDTVHVVAGAEDDIISFNSATATANGATLIVDLASVGGSGGSSTPNVSISGRVTTSGRVTIQ